MSVSGGAGNAARTTTTCSTSCLPATLDCLSQPPWTFYYDLVHTYHPYYHNYLGRFHFLVYTTTNALFPPSPSPHHPPPSATKKRTNPVPSYSIPAPQPHGVGCPLCKPFGLNSIWPMYASPPQTTKVVNAHSQCRMKHEVKSNWRVAGRRDNVIVAEPVEDTKTQRHTWHVTVWKCTAIDTLQVKRASDSFYRHTSNAYDTREQIITRRASNPPTHAGKPDRFGFVVEGPRGIYSTPATLLKDVINLLFSFFFAQPHCPHQKTHPYGRHCGNPKAFIPCMGRMK